MLLTCSDVRARSGWRRPPAWVPGRSRAALLSTVSRSSLSLRLLGGSTCTLVRFGSRRCLYAGTGRRARTALAARPVLCDLEARGPPGSDPGLHQLGLFETSAAPALCDGISDCRF